LPIHKSKRLEFRRKISEDRDPRPIIFADELIVCQKLEKGGIWTQRGRIIAERFYPKKQYATSVVVWGVVAKSGYGSCLLHSPRSVTHDVMLIENEIIAELDAVFWRRDCIWEPGNAPLHFPSKANLASVMDVFDRPANRPDLWPIE